ncbi:DNA polymerase III subunit gamma/tau [Spiribacter pallidus]|uniref:DNA polymerase III subunit gamma/tau n=2 Tax=Spiribacter pallidus TaxID=1987936 RepID=A0ABV3TB06_9GAMM
MAGAPPFPILVGALDAILLGMSYQVLARKWRPRTFAEMVGQRHVLQALSNGLANGRLHHAYLFSGTRGVGKTTVARILAKCLNCERDGVTDTPCGECAACTEIDEGRFVDLIEVDAASRTKVEDTRELLDNVQYAPSRGRFKIYLVDEVHMLSTHSFNALLKTLEEPPPHIKFLLATTDPQKLPVTVLSRCLQFNLKPLLPGLMTGQLQHIAEAEGIDAEPAALDLLARAADGSMRDALSLMDQALAFGSGQLRAEAVGEMLGTLSSGLLFDLLERLLDGDGHAMLAVIDQMAGTAPDFADALARLLDILHRLALYQMTPEVIDQSDPDAERLIALAGRLDSATVQLLYQIALHVRRDLPLAPDPRSGFEMGMMRMLAFWPEPAPSAETPSAAASSAGAPSPAVSPPSPSASGGGSPLPADAPETAAGPTQPAPPQPSAQPQDIDALDWHHLAATLPLSGMAQALADHCQWGGREGDRVTLHIDTAHQHLVNETVTGRLADALSRHFGTPFKVQVRVARVEGDTPADTAARAENERMAAAREAIEQDPNIAALQETFGAEVIEDSIRPRD